MDGESLNNSNLQLRIDYFPKLLSSIWTGNFITDLLISILQQWSVILKLCYLHFERFPTVWTVLGDMNLFDENFNKFRRQAVKFGSLVPLKFYALSSLYLFIKFAQLSVLNFSFHIQNWNHKLHQVLLSLNYKKRNIVSIKKGISIVCFRYICTSGKKICSPTWYQCR